MQSKTLSSKGGYFSATLARNDLVQFWPLWTLYLVVWIIAMPVAQFVMLFGQNAYWTDLTERSQNAVSTALMMGGAATTVIALIAGGLFAMALFSYLTTPRAVGFAHALPVRREGLFLTHYLTGAGVFLAVDLLTALLTLAVWAAAGVTEFWAIGVWLLSTAGQMLFFYSFAIFCAMFAGQILAFPAFYGVMNILALGVTQLVYMLSNTFLYGWTNWNIPDFVMWLTPAVQLADHVGYRGWYDDVTSMREVTMSGLDVVAIYAVAGLVLTALALVVYKRRPSESAGDTVAIRWAKPVFRYGMGACCGLAFGQLLYALVWQEFTGSSDASTTVMAICTILMGLVGYFAAEMLVQKSFRVFKTGRRGAAALSAALLLVCIGFSVDVLGVERRIPAAEEVTTLRVNVSTQDYYNTDIEDPALIARFIALHQDLVEQQPGNDSDRYAPTQEGGWEYTYLGLRYTMKDGSTLARDYSFRYSMEDLGKDGSIVSDLAALNCDPIIQREKLVPLFDEGTRLTGGEISTMLPDGATGNDTMGFDADEIQALLDALLRDINAGHAGMDAFDSEAYRNNGYANELTIYFRAKARDGSERKDSDMYTLSFSSHYTELLAALKVAGFEMGRLITYAQMGNSEEYSDEYSSGYAYESPPTMTENLDVAIGVVGVNAIQP